MFCLWAAAHRGRSGGHAARVRPNAALTSFAAWFGNALRAAEPGCFTCHGGRQAFGLPSPAQVSASVRELSSSSRGGNSMQWELTSAVIRFEITPMSSRIAIIAFETVFGGETLQ